MISSTKIIQTILASWRFLCLLLCWDILFFLSSGSTPSISSTWDELDDPDESESELEPVLDEDPPELELFPEEELPAITQIVKY